MHVLQMSVHNQAPKDLNRIGGEGSTMFHSCKINDGFVFFQLFIIGKWPFGLLSCSSSLHIASVQVHRHFSLLSYLNKFRDFFSKDFFIMKVLSDAHTIMVDIHA